MRITEKHLKAVIMRLNAATGNHPKPYDDEGRPNVGNYHLSHAYGGVCLHRMVSAGGGVEDVFGCGHVPKRELYNRATAYVDGLMAGLDLAADRIHNGARYRW